MPGRLDAGACQDGLDLLGQHRDAARIAVIGVAGEQPEEQMDADDNAVIVELLDADDVAQLGPAHGAAQIRFRHRHAARHGQRGLCGQP
jgi:hypothetical protein